MAGPFLPGHFHAFSLLIRHRVAVPQWLLGDHALLGLHRLHRLLLPKPWLGFLLLTRTEASS